MEEFEAEIYSFPRLNRILKNPPKWEVGFQLYCFCSFFFFWGRFVPISVKTAGIDEKKGRQRNQNVIDSWWRLGGMVRMVASTCEIAGFFVSFPPPVLPPLLLPDVCHRPSSSLLQSVMSRALGHNNPQNMRMRNGSWCYRTQGNRTAVC